MHSKLQRPSSKSSSEVCVQDSRGYVVGDEICARLPYYHSHRQNQHKQDEARLQSSIHPTTSSGCRQLTQVLWLVVVQDRGCSPDSMAMIKLEHLTSDIEPNRDSPATPTLPIILS